MLSLYAAVAERSFRRYSTYTGATLAGIFTNSVFGLIYTFAYRALWDQAPDAGGYDTIDAVTFVCPEEEGDFRAIERAVDKFYTDALLREASLQTPETVVCESMADAMAAIRQMGDVVIKPLFCSNRNTPSC